MKKDQWKEETDIEMYEITHTYHTHKEQDEMEWMHGVNPKGKIDERVVKDWCSWTYLIWKMNN